mmetsp:Transcript_30771/g.45584  ORF Transcript_30771/g.45584 Transcript_30771/m.45584 type:complete len:131 (-) Transcript_30771:187-579(-)
MYKLVAVLATVASVSAFVPGSSPRFATRSTSLNADYGKYDDGMWDNSAKVEIYNAWDPATPRSAMNFNPFETFEGNTPDASGRYPGEAFYKDPKRGDINFNQMMVERKEAEARAASPKPGDAPGCAGCKN